MSPLVEDSPAPNFWNAS